MFVADLYLSQWEECIRDCNEVLNREPQNLKGKYYITSSMYYVLSL